MQPSSMPPSPPSAPSAHAMKSPSSFSASSRVMLPCLLPCSRCLVRPADSCQGVCPTWAEVGGLGACFAGATCHCAWRTLQVLEQVR